VLQPDRGPTNAATTDASDGGGAAPFGLDFSPLSSLSGSDEVITASRFRRDYYGRPTGRVTVTCPFCEQSTVAIIPESSEVGVPEDDADGKVQMNCKRV